VIPRVPTDTSEFKFFIRPKWLNLHPEHCGTWNGRVTMALRLTQGIKRMHQSGLCHSDLSDNNLFGNAKSGDAVIIDLDGLVVPGLPFAQAVVMGTLGYMSPELTSGDVQSPSIATESHSLAVLIYQLLLLRHPLDGPLRHNLTDATKDEVLSYGANALYSEHPEDRSNRPAGPIWTSDELGSRIATLMRRVFVDGLHDPSNRPQAWEWEAALIELGQQTVECGNSSCPFGGFPLPDGPVDGMLRCPWCGTKWAGGPLPILTLLDPVAGQVGRFTAVSRIVGKTGAGLKEWQTKTRQAPTPFDAGQPWVELVPADGDDGWYLVNRSAPRMEASSGDGVWREVPAGQAVRVVPGRYVRFDQDPASRVVKLGRVG
jgi:DNA-binding helix-hairpin-helix protein with protein kinase domain